MNLQKLINRIFQNFGFESSGQIYNTSNNIVAVVTGIMSLFPDTKTGDIRNAVIPVKRNSIIIQLLNGENAYKILSQKKFYGWFMKQ